MEGDFLTATILRVLCIGSILPLWLKRSYPLTVKILLFFAFSLDTQFFTLYFRVILGKTVGIQARQRQPH